MDTINPMLSPLIWTSMATGFTPDIHGILDFVEADAKTGELLPITGRSRRVPALWNIASAFERTVSVVGWWGTWPAERVNGTMVSDRLYYTLGHGADDEAGRRDPPHLVFPAAATDRFTSLRRQSVRETDWRRVRDFMEVPEATFNQAVATAKGMADPVDGFRRILAATSTYFGAGHFLANRQPDLLMLYIQGTDEINHVLAPYVSPPVADVGEREAAILAAAVQPYFEYVDRWIGRLLERCPLSDYVVLLVSDHGTRWGDDRPRGLAASTEKTALYWHTPDAVFVVAGNGIANLGGVDERYSVYDVAPSIMALLGLPPGEGWKGRLLPGIDAPGIEGADYRSLLPAASYLPSVDGAAPADPEQIAKLRALGYLSDLGSDLARKDLGGREDQSLSEANAAGATPDQLANLGLVLIDQKRYVEAEKNLRAAIDLNPSSAVPHNHLRRLYMETGRWDEADRELWTAVDKGSTLAESRVNQAALDYEKLGEPGRVDTILSEGLRRFPDREPFWTKLIGLRIDGGRCGEALEIGREAAEVFPESARVFGYYGFAAACAGDFATGRGALERSLELDPDQPDLREALARFPR